MCLNYIMDDIETQETNPKIIKHMLNLYENNLITSDDLASILERLKDKTNEKNWNKEYTDIISCTCERSQCYRYMHEKSSEYYKNISKRLTYYNMALSFLLSSYTIICSEINFFKPEIVALVSGIGHLIVASLTGIQKQMKLPEKSESHTKICSTFDSFCRELEYQLRLPIDDRQIVPKYVLSSIDKYENIVHSSPKIPSKILHSFRYWASSNLEIDQPSIVRTFTNVHDINVRETYYEEPKSINLSKYMKEFLDIKHLNAENDTNIKDDKVKYKHKKTNRTPKMIRKVHKHNAKKNIEINNESKIENKDESNDSFSSTIDDEDLLLVNNDNLSPLPRINSESSNDDKQMGSNLSKSDQNIRL